MMRVTTDQDGKVFIEAEMTNRYGVYLDNDSLLELARTRDSSLRDRFVAAMNRRGTLLFSLTNAIELSGPQGNSVVLVRQFLDRFGAEWIPLELNPWKVVKRESEGRIGAAPLSEAFMLGYAERRLYDLSPEGSEIVGLSEDFFRLSSVMDWVQEERESIRADIPKMDDSLRGSLSRLRTEYDQDPTRLERFAPPIPYDSRTPASFVLTHLMRTLVLEAKAYSYVPNDALDFCHAVVATAYGSLITLDKAWKRRVGTLPRPNQLAYVFYRPEVPELVTALESLAT